MARLSTSARLTKKLRAALLFTFMLQLPALCMAQDSPDVSVTANARGPDASTKSTPSSTSSAPAQTHTIQVGLADHKFKPDVIAADVGDTVEFRFHPANHSVVRAEFDFPCIPYEMTGTNKKGFFSGFFALDKVIDDPPKYSLKINDSAPIFFYCSAPGSCITYAMVGAINPNSSTPIEKQQQGAKDSAYMLNPGEPFPPEQPLPSNLPTSITTPAPVATATPIPSPKHTALSPGAIAGIAIGAVCVVVLGALLFFFWGRTNSLKDEATRAEPTTPQQPAHAARAAAYSSSTLPPPSAAPAMTHLDNKYPLPSSPQHLPLHSHPAFALPPSTALPHAPAELSPHANPSSYFPARTLSPYGAAPPYGWHVEAAGLVEMDASAGLQRARWEEVGGPGGGQGEEGGSGKGGGGGNVADDTTTRLILG
ncbi:hypothetical protein BDU57DRAFT_581723 [Ampelomyces quisqualis]|uniref:Cupredoxin n=1 Tax=Ampelomyces quisqualis TaxID=50730 RepID=A0A6A5QC95_AMPQU|nr:hypothetical protein BDU57DRAFT_581723 [Ampelomyces quisqualis]